MFGQKIKRLASRFRDEGDSYLIVDDSVQDKRYSRKIGLVKNQYSGAEHGLVNGIGIVNLVHSNGGDFCTDRLPFVCTNARWENKE